MLAKILHAYSPRELIGSFVLIGVVVIVVLYFLVFHLLVKPIDLALHPIYREGTVSEVSYLNPLLYSFNSVNRDITELVYDSLVRYNPEKAQFEPAIANYAISDDVKTYTFTLKKDVYWHDGKEVTIDDVLFTYNDILKNTAFDNDLIKAAFIDVEIEKVDENTVNFVLAQPNAFFLANLMMPVLPRHVFGEAPLDILAGDIPTEYLIGNGPYKFEEKDDSDVSVVTFKLSSFKDYYFGAPEISDVELAYYADNDALIADLDSLSAVSQLPNELGDELFTGLEMRYYQLPHYQALFLNQESSLLSTERVRKIIKNAFDKQALVDALPNKEAIAGPYFFLEEFDTIPERDLVFLKNQLDDLGFVVEDGVRTNDEGEKLDFVFLVREFTNLAQKQEQEVVVAHILETAKELSISVDVVKVDAETFAAKLVNKDYDWVLYGQDFAYNLDAYGFWHSSQAGVGSLNLANFQSVSADAILEDLRNVQDQSVQRELLVKLNITLKAEAPAIFLYTQKYRFAFDNLIRNRTILPDYATTSDRFFDIQTWEID